MLDLIGIFDESNKAALKINAFIVLTIWPVIEAVSLFLMAAILWVHSFCVYMHLHVHPITRRLQQTTQFSTW